MVTSMLVLMIIVVSMMIITIISTNALLLFGFDMQSQAFIESNFQFEELQVRSDGRKITDNLRREIDNLTGERTARRYLAKTLTNHRR